MKPHVALAAVSGSVSAALTVTEFTTNIPPWIEGILAAIAAGTGYAAAYLASQGE